MASAVPKRMRSAPQFLFATPEGPMLPGQRYIPFGLGCEDWANPSNQAEELGSSSARDLYLIGTFVKRK